MGGGGGGPCGTSATGVLGRTGAFTCSISTGADDCEKMLRPRPEYSSDSACAIHSGCRVGSRLAATPGILAAACSLAAGVVLAGRLVGWTAAVCACGGGGAGGELAPR